MKIRLFNLIVSLICTLINSILHIVFKFNLFESAFLSFCTIFILSFLVFFILFEILYWIFSIFVALSCSNKKQYKKLSRFYTWFMYSWYDYFLHFMRTKIEVSGLENFPFNKRFLLVCNHRSNFDNMIICSVIKKDYICYISKPENFRIPFAGRIANRAMYLSMPKDDNREALKVILKSIEYIKNNEMSIGVFPEGTRSKTGEILEFKPGCFKIAEKAECPIVVMTLDGTEKIYKNFPFHKTVIKMDILKVYSSEDIKNYKTVELSDEIRNLMIKHFDK